MKLLFYLLIKFNLNLNKTALHMAVDNGNIEIVRLLLSIKEIDINAKSIFLSILFISFKIIVFNIIIIFISNYVY